MVWWSFTLWFYCLATNTNRVVKFEETFSGYSTYEFARERAESLMKKPYCDVFITYDKYEVYKNDEN